MRIIDGRDARALESLTACRKSPVDRALVRRVRAIVDRVRRGGDQALERLARRFDRCSPPLEVSPDEIARAAASVPDDVRLALHEAAGHIARIAFRQIPKHFDHQIVPGVVVEQRVEPLARVGCCVPGGRFPLPSSLLMTAVPARVAGVREIVVVCPRPEPVVMAAAIEAGVTTMYRVGGAHAVAALAYGTASIPRVDKIVGPGSRYVAEAKALVAGDCAIDFYAGPTELVIVAGSGKSSWIAADLLAQAEHDPDARALLITWNPHLAAAVVRTATRLSKGRPIAEQALAANGAAIVVRDAREAIALANRLAPEHVVVDREALTRQSITAGSVFVGKYATPAAGDYATGANHVLPTSGAARFRGGLSAADFVRVMTVQRVSREGLGRLATIASPLARAEGLAGHAESIELRLQP
jgi:histidinol dehydrogenase